MKLRIITPEGREYFRTDTGSARLKDIADSLQSECRYEILCARVNHETRRLTDSVESDCTIELLDLRTNEANLIYQFSLTLLFTLAVHEVLGRDVSVIVHNSLSKGLFITLKPAAFTEEDLLANEPEPVDERENLSVEELDAEIAKLEALKRKKGMA